MDKLKLSSLGLLLLLLIVSCGPAGNGNGNGNGNDNDNPPTDDASPTDGPTAGQEVGRVEQIFDVLVRVAGSNAAEGDPLVSGAEMQTDGNGRARFEVRAILEECTIREESQVVVAPSPGTPLSVERGKVVCLSKPGGTEEFQVAAGQARIGFLDPIFVVDVDGPGTQVQVDYGFVNVSNGLSSDSLLIGPGGQISIPRGAMPERASRFETTSLDDFDEQTVSRMRGILPAEPQGLPDTSNSAALSSIQASDRLRVGFDEQGSGSTERFAEGLFGAIARRWDVAMDVVGTDPDEADRALQRGEIQAFVSPDPVPGTASLGLFDGEDEASWFLTVRPDPVLQSSLEATLQVLLNNGEYGDAYYSAFERVPSYEAVRALVYPSSGQAGEDLWAESEDQSAAEAEVSEVNLSADPEDYAGSCPAEISFLATIVIETPGRVEFEFLLNGDRYDQGTIAVEQRGIGQFSRTVTVDQSESGSMELVIRSGQTLAAEASYAVSCASPSPSPT